MFIWQTMQFFFLARRQKLTLMGKSDIFFSEPIPDCGGREQIIEIAKKKHVDAIIPGYGFLSENSNFARDAASAGIVFVGPSPESIEAFGLKHTARELATKAGVPIVPGSQGLVTSEEEAVTVSQSLGFPVRYSMDFQHAIC